MAGLHLEVKLRPCLVGDEDAGIDRMKCLFHCWVHHYGEQWQTPVLALVEAEDGHIFKCHPNVIQFIDNPHADYIWPGPTEDKE